MYICHISTKEIFGQSPCGIIFGRPETDLRFLRLLRGNEVDLFKFASKDLEQRKLTPETKTAVASLGAVELRIQRVLLQEILERCMFLYHWSGKHARLVSTSSWEALVQKAVSIIKGLKIDARFLARSSVSEADRVALRPKTWVELVVFEVVELGGPSTHASPWRVRRRTPPKGFQNASFFHYFFDAFFNRFLIALGSIFQPNLVPKTNKIH